MAYVWKPEQVRCLTYGSTVVCDRGQGWRVPVTVINVRASLSGVFVYFGDGESDSLDAFDPSTLTAPSIDFVTHLAELKLGSVHVHDGELLGVEIFWGRLPDTHCWAHRIVLSDDANGDRYRNAVKAIVALSGAGLGR